MLTPREQALKEFRESREQLRPSHRMMCGVRAGYVWTIRERELALCKFYGYITAREHEHIKNVECELFARDLCKGIEHEPEYTFTLPIGV